MKQRRVEFCTIFDCSKLFQFADSQTQVLNEIFMLRYSSFFSIVFAACVAVTTFAQEKDPSQIGSLTKVPADAGYYFATMNHQRLYDGIFESNAYDHIKESVVSKGMKKAYRRGKSRGYEDYNVNNPIAQYLQGYGTVFSGVVAESAWDIAEQIVGEEVFVYVGNDTVRLAKAAQAFQAEMMKSIPMEDFAAEEMSDEAGAIIGKLFIKHFSDIDCPTMVMGARLRDPEGIRGMLELVRSGAESMMAEIPDELSFIQQGWKVVENERQYLMTLNIDLAELPWDELYEELGDDELALQIEDFLLNKVGSITFGVSDNMLVVGVAKNSAKVTDFGDGPKLIDLPALAELKKAIDGNEPITSVYYVSKEYAQATGSLETIANLYAPAIEAILASDENIPEDQREMLMNLPDDFKELARDVSSVMQPAGMVYGFTAMSEDGIRGHTFTESWHPGLDGTQPLTLGMHTDENNIGFFVQRSANLKRQFELAAKWGGKLYGYVSKPAIDQILDASKRSAEDNPDKAEEYQLNDEALVKAIKVWEEFIAKTSESIRENLIPAVDGQELGLFVDMVPNPDSFSMVVDGQNVGVLPLPRLALKSDNVDGAKKFGVEFWSDSEAMMKELVKLFEHNEKVQEFKYNPPTRNSTEFGEVFQWSAEAPEELPELAMKMTAAFSKDTMTMGLDEKQVVRGLTPSTESKVFGPATSTKNSAALVFYDHRVVAKGAWAWADVMAEALKENGVEMDLSSYEAERDTLQFNQDQLMDHAKRIWGLMSCFKGFSSRSYEHRGGMATDFLLKFKDIESAEK